MQEPHRTKCHAIIHAASVASAAVGAGLSQVPVSDCVGIIPIQIAMIISLGGVFGIELTKSAARATLATTTATMVGKGIAKVLLGWIPILGNIINATTAAGVTEMIGWSVASEFDKQYNRKQLNHNKYNKAHKNHQ